MSHHCLSHHEDEEDDDYDDQQPHQHEHYYDDRPRQRRRGRRRDFDESHSSSESEEDLSKATEEEAKHFQAVLTAFNLYKRATMEWISKKDLDFLRLPKNQQERVPHMKERFALMRKGAIVNGLFLQRIAAPHQLFENKELLPEGERTIVEEENQGNDPTPLHLRYWEGEDDSQAQSHGDDEGLSGHYGHGQHHAFSHQRLPPEADLDKVRSTLRQFVRDWSQDGIPEREQSYGPILEELTEQFKSVPFEDKKNIKVLCPGSGLGRLPWEVARLGFASQGNEFSFYMLIPSNFILNRVTRAEQFEIYPFIHSTSNVVHTRDHLRSIKIPDQDPRSLPSGVDFSMCAGDFIEVYGQDTSQHEQWDVVATCFFIDTAKNIIDYIEVINKILKPGGRWINLGPLLYHFADMGYEHSIELSYQQIRSVISSYGLVIQKEIIRPCSYTTTYNSMLKIIYNCVFFSVWKPSTTASSTSSTSSDDQRNNNASGGGESSSSSSSSSTTESMNDRLSLGLELGLS